MLITASVVTYNNNLEDIKKVINSFLNTDMNVKLFISDNSNNSDIENIYLNDLSRLGNKLEYINNNSNKGFGYGHNIAIRKAEMLGSSYHIVINPDIYYDKGEVEKMILFMNKNENIGLMMPKVLYPDNRIQYICKLLPNPVNIIIRRLFLKFNWANKINNKYEMRFSNYDHIMDVPFVSGCFMLFRTSVFKNIGYFDENIFMYFEDTDISRRVHKKYRTVMYPDSKIYHKWERGAYNNKKQRNRMIKSMIYYFNKWGWFFDKDRKIINNNILKKYIKD